jgi:hypothetical protein
MVTVEPFRPLLANLSFEVDFNLQHFISLVDEEPRHALAEAGSAPNAESRLAARLPKRLLTTVASF